MLKTIRELSASIKLSENTIRKLIKEGMPKVNACSKLLFDEVDVIEWLKSRKEG